MKKFPSTDWRHWVLVIATWVVRRRKVVSCALWIPPILLAALLLAAWLDPQRPVRREQRVAQRREIRARDEARLAEEVKVVPPTGPVHLDFRKLDFRLPPEAEDPSHQGKGYNRWLPDSLRAYDGRKITIEGFMMPTRTKNGEVTEFVVLADQLACCYGQVPRFCGFILARVTGKPVPVQQDRPLLFEGTLRVGDVFEHGYWMTIYTLECTDAGPPMFAKRTKWR